MINVDYGKYSGEICWRASSINYPNLTEYADSYKEAWELMIDAIETTKTIIKEKDLK